MALRKTEKIDSLWTGRGQARLARAGEGSVHAVANWTWCPESEVGRHTGRALAAPISGYCHPEQVSNANEVEGSRTASKIPRPLSCGRGQAARRLRVFATAVTR